MQLGIGPNGRLTLNGVEMDSHDPRLYGSAGRIFDTGSYDPRYWNETVHSFSEGSPYSTYELKPEIAARLRGRVQLPQAGIGGYAEGMDVGGMDWDDEFGALTLPSNIRETDPHGDRISAGMAAAMAAGFAGAAGAHMAAGAGAGSGAGAAEIPGDIALNTGTYEGTSLVDMPAIGGGGGGSPLGGMYAEVPGDLALNTSTYGSTPLVDMPAIQSSNPSVWSRIAAGDYSGALSQAGQSVMDDPMRAMQLINGVVSLGGLASDHDDEGGSGPSELGSMGWKPPVMEDYQPAMYDPRYGSPFSGWLDQYQQSLRPIGRMYG